MKATIWHNPRCSKSREALAILDEAGADVRVVEYLREPPSADELARLYAAAAMRPAEGLRRAEKQATVLADAPDQVVLAAMAADPILMERPLVETERGVRLGRPPERVREIL